MEKILMYLQGILAIAITFGLAVFVHEFGHMFFALLRGVGVESFAIGMGPKITAWKWRGIEFSLRWFPVGGFVKLAGRTPPPEAESGEAASAQQAPAAASEDGSAAAGEDKSLAESSYDDLFALQDKGFLTKVMVFGGGVFMNYVTAVLAITAVLLVGYKVDLFRLKVERVEAGSALAKAGLAPGDQLVQMNGQPLTYTSDFEDVLAKELDKAGIKVNEVATDPPADSVARFALALVVERGGKSRPLALAPMSLKELKEFTSDFYESIWRPAYVDKLIPNMPADKAGLKKGDWIVAIDGKPVDSYNQMVDVIHASLNREITMKVKRGGKFLDLPVTPQPGIPALDMDPKKGYIGIPAASPEKRAENIRNPFKALVAAQRQSIDQLTRIVTMNVKFFKTATMKEVRENVTGPIGIAAITAKMAQKGLEELVQWFILLNLLLAFFNLLPLPVLDGGFILLAVIEGVIRRPVPPKILAPIYTAFVVGFIILMVLISVQDLTNWVPRLLR